MLEWLVFLISVVPFLELRIAIPLAIAAIYDPAIAAEYDPVSVLVICVVLNLLVIPIAFFILDFILPPIRRRVKFIDRIFRWSVKRARKHRKLSLAGLAAFVAVPLPVTGAYTGSLIAYATGLNRKRAALAIATGVIIAGVLVWLAMLGIIGILGISPP